MAESSTSTAVLPAKPFNRIPADDLPQIADRYRSGESLTSIGESYGVSNEAVRQRIERWAITHDGEGAMHELVTDYLAENVVAAKDRAVNAKSILGVACAREEVTYWKWILERRRPKLYGQKSEVKTDTNITVTVQLLPSTPQPVVIHDIENVEGIDKIE